MRYVYVIRNQANGKVYVGQTKKPTKRKAGHFYLARRGDQRPLYASMRKHGIENFTFEVIEECVDELINDREQHWVAHFDSFNPEKGYNLTRGGEQLCEVSEEVRQRLVELNSGEKNPMFGRHHTKAVKKMIGIAQVGNRHGEGHQPTPEERAQRSQSLRQHWSVAHERRNEMSQRLKREWAIGQRRSSCHNVKSQATELLQEGRTVNEVVELTGLSRSTIYRIKCTFK